MALTVKPGARCRSLVSDTEVVVVKGTGEVDLRCGNEPMVDVSDTTASEDTADPVGEGSLVGKRYTNADGTIEVLCTKAGAGALAVGDEPLQVKGAKPLPSSD